MDSREEIAKDVFDLMQNHRIGDIENITMNCAYFITDHILQREDKLLEELKVIVNVSDKLASDTDPYIDDDMTDDDIKHELPEFWINRELYRIIETNSKESK